MTFPFLIFLYNSVFMNTENTSIPEDYQNTLKGLCRLYNMSCEGNHLDIDSINMKTHIKDNLGIRRIDVLHAEVILESRYPAIDGLSHAPGITTIGDAIRYIESNSRI